MAINPIVKYPAQVDADPDYPFGKARNESSRGARDGTPFTADVLNDIWGFHQSLLAETNATPSGAADQVGYSQYLRAIDAMLERRGHETAAANWTAAEAADGYEGVLSGLAHGRDRVVAVGHDGGIQVSFDGGETWRTSTADGAYTGDFRSVAFGPGPRFVAVGQFGEIQTGLGVEYERQAADGGYTDTFTAVAAGPNLYVAVGLGGEIQTSPDGFQWTRRAADGGYSGFFWDVTFAGTPATGFFIAVGSGGEIQTSQDGIEWTKRPIADGFDGDVNSIAYHSGHFAAGTGTGNRVYRSRDGIEWTTIAGRYPGGFRILALTASDRLFVGVGGSGGIYTSHTGRVWREHVAAAGYSRVLRAAVWDGHRFVVAGDDGGLQYSLRA